MWAGKPQTYGLASCCRLSACLVKSALCMGQWRGPLSWAGLVEGINLAGAGRGRRAAASQCKVVVGRMSTPVQASIVGLKSAHRVKLDPQGRFTDRLSGSILSSTSVKLHQNGSKLVMLKQKFLYFGTASQMLLVD